MQMLSVSSEDSSIFLIILVCLLALLAWNLFLISTSIWKLLSIHEASKSRRRCKEAASNYLDARSIPWNRRNQFLAKASVEKRVVLGPSEIDSSLPKRLLGVNFQDIREFVLKNFLNNFELSTKNSDGLSVEIIETNIRNDTDDLANKILNVNRRLNMNSNVASIEEINNVELPINEERSSRDEVTFQEETCTMSGTKFMDRLEEKFGESMMKSFSTDTKEKYAKDAALDHEKRDTSWKNNEVPSPYKLRAHLEIERDSKICQERSANLEMKIEERPETIVSRSLAEKFLASILQESSVFRTNSKELLNERTIDFEANAPDEVAHSTGKHVTEVEKEENRNTAKGVERLEEFLSCTVEDKDNEICEERKEGDYPNEQFGVVPEKGANCMEEESVVHSSKNATQSRMGREEEEVGAPPATNSLKNGQGAESTIFLGQPASTRHGKEEDDLNAIIRKMIIMELKRHRKKEQTMLKRAHSDTESVLPRKKHNAGNRTGLFSIKGRTFFRDLLELEENLRKGIENESDSESIEVGIDERIVERKDSARQDANSKNDVKVDVRIIDRVLESISSMATTYKADSNIQLERKVNARCLRDAGAEQSIGPRNRASTIHQLNKSTQTEHVYVIRAVRSCPIRKKRLPVQFQVHRLASSRDAVCSKTVFASLDLSRFIFRKASDNLIYEKGKASRSPSYIPVPERCRWKYVTPSKAK